MVKRSDLKDWGTKFLIVLGLWSIIMLLISSITIFSTVQEGSPVDFWGIILFELVCISPWIICTPLIIWLARSYRFDNQIRYKNIFIHLAAAALVFSFHSIVQSNAVFYYYDYTPSWSYIMRDFWGFLDVRVILYIGILFIVYAIDFQKKNRAIRLRKSKLKTELSRAKFHALLNQIQPDFLLNTIDAINEKLDENLEEAEEILTDFSDLLRIMLNSVSREEAIVQQDLKSYTLYINILNRRLNTKIRQKTEIDPNAYQALIPSFLLLIPLFEQIIESPKFNHSKIESIGYSASQKDNRIVLGIDIKGHKIGGWNISALSQKSGLPEIVKSLRMRYGQEVRFHTTSDNDSIHFDLKMPYIIEGVPLAAAE